MTKQILLEKAIDTLIEVGNGTTDEMLKEACDDLFIFRKEFDKLKKLTEDMALSLHNCRNCFDKIDFPKEQENSQLVLDRYRKLCMN